MKIVFDTDACKKFGRDIDLILYLISIYAGSKITVNTFEKARQQSFLRFNQSYNSREPFPTYIDISEEGKFLVETIMAEGNTKEEPEDRFTALAEKLRAIFPPGKKPGYANTWRDSPSCIADRLKKFVLKYGDYPDERIIDVTKKYVASFNGNYTYMQTLKYFIWKNKTTGGELIDGRLVGEVERQSQLASWLEDEEDEHVNELTDWGIELK